MENETTTSSPELTFNQTAHEMLRAIVQYFDNEYGDQAIHNETLQRALSGLHAGSHYLGEYLGVPDE